MLLFSYKALQNEPAGKIVSLHMSLSMTFEYLVILEIKNVVK